MPPVGKRIAQGRSEGAARPHSSPLMKFPIRPAASPMGTEGTRKSATCRNGRDRRQAKNAIPRITPMAPPWKLIPPSQTLKTSSGWVT